MRRSIKRPHSSTAEVADDLEIGEEEQELNNRLRFLRRQRMALRNRHGEGSTSDDQMDVNSSANYYSDEDLEVGEIPKWCLDLMERRNIENSSDSDAVESRAEPKPICSADVKASKAAADQDIELQRSVIAIRGAADALKIAATEKPKLLNENQIDYCGEVCISDRPASTDADMSTIMDQVSALPRPTLRCTMKDRKNIQLSWAHSDLPTNSSKILRYELFVYIPQKEPRRNVCIKKMQPLRLPMACTLNSIVGNTQYYFTLRYVFDNGTAGPFSEKIGIYMKPKKSVVE